MAFEKSRRSELKGNVVGGDETEIEYFKSDS
jgi:hypothetical protein